MGARTDVGQIDYSHVVPAISDPADPLLGEVPDETGNVFFLRRRAPARDIGEEFSRDLDKLDPERGKTCGKCGRGKHIVRGSPFPTWGDLPSMTRQQSTLF